jgi:hypothetical protein
LARLASIKTRWHGRPVLRGRARQRSAALTLRCRRHGPRHRVVAKRCAAQIFASSHCGCRSRSPWPLARLASIKKPRARGRGRARQRSAALTLGAGVTPAHFAGDGVGSATSRAVIGCDSCRIRMSIQYLSAIAAATLSVISGAASKRTLSNSWSPIFSLT